VLAEIFPALSPLARYLTSNVGKWADLRVAELHAQAAAAQSAVQQSRLAGGTRGAVGTRDGSGFSNKRGSVENNSGFAEGSFEHAGAYDDSKDDGGGDGGGDVDGGDGGGDDGGGDDGVGGGPNPPHAPNQSGGIPAGMQLEIDGLLARGPAADQMLTDALETLIVLRTESDE
jgi:hypothetical protein